MSAKVFVMKSVDGLDDVIGHQTGSQHVCCWIRRFIGEESVAAGECLVLTDSPTWIIDPIDGTVNFVHR